MPWVTFSSDRFAQTPAPDAINDMLGKDLAEWLRAGLETTGFEVGEVIAEDYGYGFWLKMNQAHYWITQAQYEPEEARPQPTWMVGIDNDPGCLWVWRLRARPHSGDENVIARAVHDRLREDRTISDIHWWTRDARQDVSSPEPPREHS
jgi:hypothetical protein